VDTEQEVEQVVPEMRYRQDQTHLSWVAWPELRAYERAALRLTAGLGLTPLVLSIAALTGWFSQATAVLGTLAAIGLALVIRNAVRASWAVQPHRSRVAPWVMATFCSRRRLCRIGIPWCHRASDRR
jgi:hypothetical protein